MKRLIAALLLTLLAALPVHAAGKGTIEETDTAIIVEFTGDAKDLPVEKYRPEGAVPVQKTSPEAVAALKPQPEGVSGGEPAAEAPAPVRPDKSVREARAKLTETLRQKKEARAAMQATRQQRGSQSSSESGE